ncbi:MAG: hypothetical protein QXO70_03135, partial [Candidatus Pacearchaeota archaeon]
IYKKYYNFEGFKSGCTLYNANRLVNSSKKEVVIVEGPFDAVIINRYLPTVSILGKSLDKIQAERIANMAKRAIVMLDSDAPASSVKIYNLLNSKIPTTAVFLDTGDPDELSDEQIRKYLNLGDSSNGS